MFGLPRIEQQPQGAVVSTTEPAPESQVAAPRCYRHPKRETYVRCTRCDRPICPDCMQSAAVGQHCPDCVRGGSKTVRQARTVFGGRVTATPVITYTLIAVNVLAYLAELASSGVEPRFSYWGLGVAAGQWYRLLTGPFLHSLPGQNIFGITHIIFNMVALAMLGPVVEEVLGRLRFLSLYLLSALGGSVLTYLIAPAEASVGASGAVFGVAAAYFIISRRLHRNVAYATRLVVAYVIWLVISAQITSWQGHLGGLLAGGALALGYAYAPDKRRGLVQTAATVGMAALLVVLVLVKTAQLKAGFPG